MNAETLLTELRRKGVEVVAAGDKVRYRPADRVTADLLMKIRNCKGELLSLLSAPQLVEDSWSAGCRVVVAGPIAHVEPREYGVEVPVALQHRIRQVQVSALRAVMRREVSH